MVAILLLGAYLRLAKLEYGQFLADDVALWSTVRGLAEHPQILTRGMESSLGIPNGPFQAYLLIPGLLTSPSPIGAYYVVSLLNVLSIALFWRFVRNYWGPALALLASLLYAVNPWATIFSRRLWGDNMMAPFTVLLVWSLCDLVRYGRKRDSVLPFVWLAVVVQLYNAAFTEVGVAALGIALGFRRLRAKPAAVGATLSALLVAPYVLGTIVPSLGNLAGAAGADGQPAVIDATSIRHMVRLVSSEGYRFFTNPVGGELDVGSGLPRAASLLLEAALVVGIGVAVRTAVRRARRIECRLSAPLVLSLAAVALPAALTLKHAAPVYPYYLLGGFPFHFLLVALGLRVVWLALGRLTKTSANLLRLLPDSALVALAALVTIAHLQLGNEFLTLIQGRTPIPAYGMPLRYTDEVAETARDLAAKQGLSRIYVGGAAESDREIYLTLKNDFPDVSQFDPSDSFVAPDASAGKALYILSSHDDWVGQAFARRFGAAPAATVEVPGPQLRYYLYAVSATDLLDLFPTSPTAFTFDGQLRLDGYATERELLPGRPNRLLLRWKVKETASTYNLYVTLMRQSEEVAEEAGHGVEQPFDAVGRWQPGESVWMLLPVPTPTDLAPGAYSYLVGLYALTPDGFRDVSAVAEGGASTVGGVRVGGVAVRSRTTSQPTYPLNAPFAEQVLLTGYDLSSPVVEPGGDLQIGLYWSALRALDRDYTVFLHLLGHDGKIVAQHDAQPDLGAYPTSAWLDGNTVVDRHSLKLPSDLEPGQYDLVVGLYYLPTGERLGGPDCTATVPLAVGGGRK